MRSVLTLDVKAATKVLNFVRRQGGSGELAQVDRVLWATSTASTPLIPALFPQTPQTGEGYHRLEPLSPTVQMEVIAHHVRSNADKLRSFIADIGTLNKQIVFQELAAAAIQLTHVTATFGYSHFVLRKAALLRVLAPDVHFSESVDKILVHAGLPENNLIASSLVHCYQEEQDFLSVKRSIMSITDRGAANKFTRDISRLPFHPHASSSEELRDHIQSALQSSLLDALITASFNAHLLPPTDDPLLTTIFRELAAAAPSLDDIARLQPNVDNESELLFYKRSSAWLESPGIRRYRRLLDHFYDAPDVPYITFSESLMSEVGTWTNVSDLDDLATSKMLIRHDSQHLRSLENRGTATRSALFNYWLHSTQGYGTVAEENLIRLMGMTRDLAKTIPSAFAANLAKSVGSDISKLILYLLVAKKSRNERDDHLLRRIVQDITITRFNRSLLSLLEHLESQSPDVARYAYDVFTEDFIAKLYHLIGSTSEITDTRAELHKWMGRHTGDKVYLDRARTLLIDHQLNKVRNEIDDNRIYVDVARFHEWINEELFRDLNTALSSIEHKGHEMASPDSILSLLVERCYVTFCSHRAFGIASYLGRRIRHGTFKGHLYSGVVNLERDPRFKTLLADPHAGDFWRAWKAEYEAKIDDIIRHRLHVASQAKREGLLKPSLAIQQKTEIIVACTKALVKDFSDTNASASAPYIITEYCWRLAEVDLKAFNAYLKGQRRSLAEGLSGVTAAAPYSLKATATDFYRAIDRTIVEKLMAMQMWFKRPLTVSPKASLSLLYKAVVEEVRATYPALQAPIEVDAVNDIELFGGAYHVLYDSFYVVVYNAAKHGKAGGAVKPAFAIVRDHRTGQQSVQIEISSEIRDDEEESNVQRLLSVGPDEDVANAQTFENRSGVPKLYHLQSADPCFSIKLIQCKGRRVTILLDYRLDH